MKERFSLGVRVEVKSPLLIRGSRPVISSAHDTPRDRAKDGCVSAGIPRDSRPGNSRKDF